MASTARTKSTAKAADAQQDAQPARERKSTPARSKAASGSSAPQPAVEKPVESPAVAPDKVKAEPTRRRAGGGSRSTKRDAEMPAVIEAISQKAAAADISEDELRVLSYYLWEREGRPHGRDLEHWLAAREHLLSKAKVEG